MLRSLSLFALGCSLLLIAPLNPAFAQAGSTEDEEARSLFEAGRTAYTGARYEAALRYFEDSFELSGRAALLFNIGSTLERLQRNEEALARFREYLQRVPDAPNRTVVERRITFLEGIVSGQRADDGTNSADAAVDPNVDVSATNSTTTDTGGGGGSVIDEWWFWTIIAVAIVGVGAGVTAGVVVGTSGVEEPLPGDFPVVFALTAELP